MNFEYTKNMLNQKRNFIDYEEYLIDSLKDPEDAIEYLNTAAYDEDPRVFLLALKHFLAAQNRPELNMKPINK